jgi:hypothetical protein
MSEQRDDIGCVGMFIITALAVALMAVFMKQTSHIIDLQRRVGQLESERR